ncbi:MAG TPA: hypothetical protein VG167_14985 [Verrucomicrobiae bacterium]|nr:hypothetical protein [Verrucomicrobiae bacterium]
MKNQGPLLILGALAAAALWYFTKGRNATAARANAQPAGGGGGIAPSATGLNYVPVPAAGQPIAYAGAPVPSLGTSLALAGQSTLQNILGSLSNAGLNALGIRTAQPAQGSQSQSSSSGGTQHSPFSFGGGASPALGSNSGRSSTSTSIPQQQPTAPNQIDQGSSAWTDPATGITYDTNGNVLGVGGSEGGYPVSVDPSTIDGATLSSPENANAYGAGYGDYSLSTYDVNAGDASAGFDPNAGLDSGTLY